MKLLLDQFDLKYFKACVKYFNSLNCSYRFTSFCMSIRYTIRVACDFGILNDYFTYDSYDSSTCSSRGQA